MSGTSSAVLRLGDSDVARVHALLGRYGLSLRRVADGAPIPGSYWGESEAGLKDATLFARSDTPLHSVLHETCHYVCMTEKRRSGLDTDAGGDYAEENGVCYLQILLADRVPGMGRERMFADMDAWGYSFRLGSAQRWFHHDASDAQEWLSSRGIITPEGKPVWTLRKR